MKMAKNHPFPEEDDEENSEQSIAPKCRLEGPAAVPPEQNGKAVGSSSSTKTIQEDGVLSEVCRDYEYQNGSMEQNSDGVIADKHTPLSNESSERSRHKHKKNKLAVGNAVLTEDTAGSGAHQIIPQDKPSVTDVGIQTLAKSEIFHQSSTVDSAQEKSPKESGSPMLPLGFEDAPEVLKLRLPSWSQCKPKNGCTNKWTWYDAKESYDGFIRKKLASESDKDTGRGGADNVEQTRLMEYHDGDLSVLTECICDEKNEDLSSFSRKPKHTLVESVHFTDNCGKDRDYTNNQVKLVVGLDKQQYSDPVCKPTTHPR